MPQEASAVFPQSSAPIPSPIPELEFESQYAQLQPGHSPPRRATGTWPHKQLARRDRSLRWVGPPRAKVDAVVAHGRPCATESKPAQFERSLRIRSALRITSQWPSSVVCNFTCKIRDVDISEGTQASASTHLFTMTVFQWLDTPTCDNSMITFTTCHSCATGMIAAAA